MRTADIKNLSIAAEALSRIPGFEPERLREKCLIEIADLLQPKEMPPFVPRSPTIKDDEIPF